MKMKKILYILAFSIICTACSSGSSDDSGANQDSKPSTPILILPAQDQLCIDNTLNFTWEASTNADGSSIIYTFEIAKDNQFSDIVTSEVLTRLSKIVTLDKGVAYYWRVRAKSSKNIESDYSATSKFYTEEVPNSNHLPFAPAIISPTLGQNLDNVSTVNLEWTASDVDNDPLKYDVYFGKDKDALALVAQDSNNTSFQVTLDTPKTTYYWKVVVKDDKGAQVTGQLWDFKVNNL